MDVLWNYYSCWSSLLIQIDADSRIPFNKKLGCESLVFQDLSSQNNIKPALIRLHTSHPNILVTAVRLPVRGMFYTVLYPGSFTWFFLGIDQLIYWILYIQRQHGQFIVSLWPRSDPQFALIFPYGENRCVQTSTSAACRQVTLTFSYNNCDIFLPYVVDML